jgi:branched-chain amino acid transport system permease protein
MPGVCMTGSEVFIQQLLNGLTIGSYLALVALGYTMVYGIIELINFAHGDVYMMGFFISLSFLGLLGATSTLAGFTLIWVIASVMLTTMVCTGLINLAIDRIAYKPLRRAPRLAPLITAVGASFVLANIAQNWKGPSQVLYPNIFPTINILRDLLGLETQVLFTTKDIFLIAVTAPLMVGLHLFIRYSKLGKAMRATAQDREAAAMMGINVERIIMLTFFIGGALAGAAGMVFGIYLNTGRYLMGFEAGLKAFTAAVLGGIGNIPGAVLGGYLIGFLSAFSDQYLSSAWTRAAVFLILVLVLVFKPTGILGERPLN